MHAASSLTIKDRPAVLGGGASGRQVVSNLLP